MVLIALSITAVAAQAATVPVGPTASAARVGSASPSAKLQLVLPLKANLRGLSKLALAVSTPGNPQYGHYQSIAQLSARFGASRHAERRTIDYLQRVGASQVRLDATGLFVDATLSAATAERLFATPLTEFRSRQGLFTAPSLTPSVPSALRGLVTGVVGLDTRPVATSPQPVAAEESLRTKLAAEQNHSVTSVFSPIASAAQQTSSAYTPASGAPSGCPDATATGSFTPNQYLTAYDYSPLQAAGLTGQGERLALIEIDGYKASDIQAFATCFGLHVPPIKTFGVGISKPLAPGPETTLDLEVMTAAAPGLKQVDVYESNADESHALRALTAPLQNKGFKPTVISASLGLCEPFVAGAVGASGLENTEAALEEAAAAGISFLDASGDDGSADCTNQNGQPYNKLAVNYPTSSEWVTGVGGTNIALNPANQLTSEIVWNDAALQPGSAGGGGKSVLFNRPPYQKGTVAPNRREVPDLSMLADVAPGYAIYCTAVNSCVSPADPDPWQGVGGTSAGTPLLAGGFAMIDQFLSEHKHAALGLANPLIYALGRSRLVSSVFTDVTAIGNDVGPFISASGRSLGCCTAGVGYDDASGWGSVVLGGFADAALSYKPQIARVSLTVPPGQKPVGARQIRTTVTCSAACELGATAAVRIGLSGRAKTLDSRALTLSGAGSQKVTIPFSAGELRQLRAGLAAGQTITAKITGVVIDIEGHVERSSRSVTIHITG